MPSTGESGFSEEDLCFENILSLWESGDTSYRRRLSPSFALLLHPETSAEYLEKWVLDLQNFLYDHRKGEFLEAKAYSRFYALTLELLEAGMVETLCALPLLGREDTVQASHTALENMAYLVMCPRGMPHSNKVCAEIINRGGLECMLKIITTGTFFHKVVAMDCIMVLFTGSTCGDNLTASQVAEIISTCCSYHVDDEALDNIRNPQTVYARSVIEDLFGTCENPDTIAEEVRTWFSTKQQGALDTCLLALHQHTRPITRRFSLQVLQNKPDIVHSLLSIACEPSTPGVTKGGVDLLPSLSLITDTAAAQVLLHLMIFPPEIIPGLQVMSGDDSDEDAAEWNAALQCNEMLYSDPKALEMLVKMRNKITDQDLVDLRSNLIGVCPDKAQLKQLHLDLCQKRAFLQLASLRLLINLTHLESPPALLFLALLPLSYDACARIPTLEECGPSKNSTDLITLWGKRNRGMAELTTGMGTAGGPVKVATSLAAPEPLLGPTLLFRALYRLADAGYGLDKLRRLKALPEDIPIIQGNPTYLVHILQVVEPKVMGKLIRMSVNRRVLGRRNLGKERLLRDAGPGGDTDRYTAVNTFTSAAELALAVVAFGSHRSNNLIPAVQDNLSAINRANQEVELCLEDATDAAGRLGEWKMAKRYAKNAIGFSETIQVEEAAAIGWDVASSRRRNVRRLNNALKRLKDIK